VTSEGRVTEAWRALFARHPDRFVLGSDTWINERWSSYGEILALYRGWLAQLPQDVAAAIAHGNGERLFAPR
jgi:predicted TIM-barrel fold metal-dependent hydrolase